MKVTLDGIKAKIKGETFPADVLGLERVENGPAFVRPQSLRQSDGKVIPATDAGFEAAFQAEVAAAAAVREKLIEITRHRIGDVNGEMDKARIALRRAEDLKLTEEIAALRKQIAGLEERFAALQAEAKKVTEGGAVASLVSKDAANREVVVPLTQVIRGWFPNRLDTWGRVKLFGSRLAEFVFDEPREANTEGGLMPAIFGTLVMTVFMSLLVTPFGVITAIYLREYAQQGPVLRIVRISVNNLAGVPSIVFGVFGLGFFVYVLGGSIDQLFFADQLKYNNNTPVFGTGGLLWCSLTLALMTLPVVIVATEEALAAVPRGMREASLATGASKWQTILNVVLPASSSGILTGLILAKVGNPQRDEPLQTSKDIFTVDEEQREILTPLFLKPFKNLIAHRFQHHASLEKHEMNLLATAIFAAPSSLLKNGCDIASRLYAKSNHPNIKSGDLCLSLIDDIEIEGHMTQALCILKSESVMPFLSISTEDGDLKLHTAEGINPEKIDKGCLIINH